MSLEKELEVLEALRKGQELENSDQYDELVDGLWEHKKELVQEALLLAKQHNKLSPRGFYNLGLRFYNENREEKAIEVWMDAIKNNNANTEIYGAMIHLSEQDKKIELLKEARSKNVSDSKLFDHLIELSPENEKLNLANEALEKKLEGPVAYNVLVINAESPEKKLQLTEQAIKDGKSSPFIDVVNLQLLKEKNDINLDNRFYEMMRKAGDDDELVRMVAANIYENDAKKIIQALEPHRNQELSESGIALLFRKYIETKESEKIIITLEERLEKETLSSRDTMIALGFFHKENDNQQAIRAGEIGVQLAEVDEGLLYLLSVEYILDKQFEKAYHITQRLLDNGIDESRAHHYRSVSAYELGKYEEGLEHALTIYNRGEIDEERAQILTLNASQLPVTDEIHDIVKQLIPLLEEKTIINYEIETARTLVPGLLERLLQQDKLMHEQYYLLMDKAISQKDIKKAFEIADLAKKRNKYDHEMASLLAKAAVLNKMYEKIDKILIPYEDEWNPADTAEILFSYQETDNKIEAEKLGRKILSGKLKGEYNGVSLHLLNSITKEEKYFDALKKYSKENPKDYNALGSLLLLAKLNGYPLQTKKTARRLAHVTLNNDNISSQLKELNSGTSVVKVFDTFPLQETIFVKQKNIPHDDEIRYNKKVHQALNKHKVPVSITDVISTETVGENHLYVMSYKKGIPFTNILDVKVSLDFIDALIKNNYMDHGLLQMQGLMMDAMAAIYVELPEPQLPIYDFRGKFKEKGFESIITESFEEMIEFLEKSRFMSYFNDSWSDNWIVGKEGITLADTENRGRMPITVDAAHFMAHSGHGNAENALNLNGFLMDRINNHGKENGRIIENANRFEYEFAVGTLIRSMLNARTRGAIEKRYDTAYFIAEAGVNMLEHMKETERYPTGKRYEIIEEALRNEQETYKLKFWEQMDKKSNEQFTKDGVEKDPEYDKYMNIAKQHRIGDAKKRRDFLFNTWMSAFLKFDIFPNKEFAEKVRTYLNEYKS